MRLGILISGRGSNMLSIADACTDPEFPAQIALVMADSAQAAGLAAAADRGLATTVIEPRDFSERPAFEEAMVETLRAHEVETVCLAGFMRLLSVRFLAGFPGRVLNIHPSLLPAFPGLDAQRQALDHGVRYSGCTVHFVTEAMDAGPIILQAAVPVMAADDADALAARILAREHDIYPQAIRLLAEDRLRVVGRKVQISEGD